MRNADMRNLDMFCKIANIWIKEITGHSPEQYRASLAELKKQEEEQVRNQKAQLAKEAEDEREFQEEVITAMLESGMSRNVALTLIDTEVKLLAQAKKYKVI